MPRPRRQIFANIPAHIVQRGNDRQPCFRSFKDYRSYLAALTECSARYRVDIHAFVLMTNHVHLLATPDVVGGVSRMMQQLGRKYVAYFNTEHSRTGTLWEGRFRSSAVVSLIYLYACYRYIEMNPVRAKMVDSPEQYEWSSYRTNALGHPSGLIQPRREILRLGHTAKERQSAYRRLFVGTHDEPDDVIRRACHSGRSLE